MNKHDELLRKIEDLLEEARSHINLAIAAKNLNFAVARATEARFDIRQITSRLQSLAADFQLLADEYEKMREMLMEAEEIVDRILKHPSYEGTQTRLCADKYREKYPKQVKAQQSGEEGENNER
jgi:uncharacterized membrane protein